MGIFKKLFGDSTDKSSNDINSTVKGSYEQQTTNSISQSTHVPNMTSWENFFGVNLKSSPNELWIEGESVHNEKNVIRIFTNNQVNNVYFSSVNAKVIGNSATNFFFKCPYTWDDAFDIYFLIERDLVHNGNYTNTAAAAKFRGKFDSYYDSFSWDIDGCCITMSRDINNGDIELGVWTLFYNKEYLDKDMAIKKCVQDGKKDEFSQPAITSDKTSWENFFGVNLKSSPNELWKEGELQYTEKDVIRNFTNNHVDNDYFSSVNAKVIGNSATNFFFKCPYTWDDAFDIYFLIERDFVHNGNYTNTAAAAKFRGKFDSYYDSFSWDIDGCSITMSRDINNGDIELGVWTLFYNHEYLDKTKERSETYEQKEDETTLPKKNFHVHLLGGLDTLHFVHDHLGKQLAGTASCYVARAEGTTIHLLDENDFNEVYSFESKEIADYLGNRLGAAGFIKFNCDDVTDIQAELFIIPAEDTKETSDTESEDALVHYEMSYLVDPVEIDYRRKTIMDGSMNLNIVGFQYRDNYEELKHSIKEGMSVILKPELTNEYDPNALAFYLEGNVIGYLPKKDQPFAHIFMAKGQIEATICHIDEKWIDTEVYIKKDMIDVNAFKNSGVSLTKIKSFKGGNSSSQSVDFSEFIETL